MDPVGIIQPVPAPVIPVPAATSAQLLPAADPQATPDISGSTDSQQQQYDASAAEQKRTQAVQQAAKDIANIYVVGDQKFTIFKDATGQYITRFTSLRDGKVTYVPEPELVKTTNPEVTGAALNIKV